MAFHKESLANLSHITIFTLLASSIILANSIQVLYFTDLGKLKSMQSFWTYMLVINIIWLTYSIFAVFLLKRMKNSCFHKSIGIIHYILLVFCSIGCLTNQERQIMNKETSDTLVAAGITNSTLEEIAAEADTFQYLEMYFILQQLFIWIGFRLLSSWKSSAVGFLIWMVTEVLTVFGSNSHLVQKSFMLVVTFIQYCV